MFTLPVCEYVKLVPRLTWNEKDYITIKPLLNDAFY